MMLWKRAIFSATMPAGLRNQRMGVGGDYKKYLTALDEGKKAWVFYRIR
jgi:hypothetical protein